MTPTELAEWGAKEAHMRLTAEGVAGLRKLAEIVRMAPEDRRDPQLEAAAKWIDTLGDGPIERWLVHTAKGDGGCMSCAFETQISSGLCGLALYLGDGEIACCYDEPPDQCRLRKGSVLVDGVTP